MLALMAASAMPMPCAISRSAAFKRSLFCILVSEMLPMRKLPTGEPCGGNRTHGSEVGAAKPSLPLSPQGASQANLQPQPLHFQERLAIAHGIVDGIVCVWRFAQALEVLGCVLDHALVERAEICA